MTLEIILDASQLDCFEECPYKWYRSYVLNLTTRYTNPSLSTGSFFHECLKYYYTLGQPLSKQIMPTIDYAKAIILSKTPRRDHWGEEHPPCREEFPRVIKDPAFYLRRLVDYLFKHVDEDESMEIVAVEKGFSRLLYEDEEVRFILEGMIDLVAKKPHFGLTVTDHKTQSSAYDKDPYCHQVCNYLSFTGADYFEYDYIGFQKEITPMTFRRKIFKPGPGVLNQWEQDVIKTFWEMDRFLTLEQFPRRRSNCQGQFGLCQFHKRCQIPDDSPFVKIVESAYKEKDKRWIAWK